MNNILVKDIGDTNLPFYEEIINNIPDSIFKRLQNMKSEKRRNESKMGYIMLSSIISSLDNKLFIPLISYESKPYLLNRDLYFNISHSNNKCIVVLSDKPIGVDIEKIREVKKSLVKKCLNDIEMKYYEESCDRLKCFIEIWTKKEALIKLLGKSISSDMKKYNTFDGSYQFSSFQVDDYIYSICRRV